VLHLQFQWCSSNFGVLVRHVFVKSFDSLQLLKHSLSQVTNMSLINVFIFMLSLYGDDVKDTKLRCTPSKGKTVITIGDLDACSSLIIMYDLVIGCQSFCLDAIIYQFMKDKHIFNFINHVLMMYLNFWFLVCFGALQVCLVMMTFEIFYESCHVLY